MPVALQAVLAGFLGAAFGSFFNVVAYRLPRGESLAHPGSRCPSCETPIKTRDNLPIVGWLLLRGRCRHCQAPISPRYPIVEAVTAALAVLIVVFHHPPVDKVLGLALLATLVPVSLIDLDTRKIPNVITAPSAVVAIVIGLLMKPDRVGAQLVGGVVAGGFLLIFALAYPKGLGMGDVKLAGVLGLYTKGAVAVALFAGILAGAVVGIGIMARVGVAKGRKTGIPFGPYLAFGGILAVLVGPQILHWYLQTTGAR